MLFHQQAGLHDKVAKLKKRQTTGWILTAAAVGGLVGTGLMGSPEFIMNGANPTKKALYLGLMGISLPAGLIGYHTVLFCRTTKAEARALAERHNQEQ